MRNFAVFVAGEAVARDLRKPLLIMEKKDLAIAAPCTADWRKMTPADGGRFCGDCKKVVRDLSTMRERDARTLLRSAQNGELCVRYLYDKHGKIFFAGDRPEMQLVPVSFLQRAKRVALSAAAVAVAVPLSLAACSPSAGATSDGTLLQQLQNEEHYEMMGGAPAQPPPPEEDASPGPAPDGGDAGADSAADGGSDAATDAPPAETPI